jgi:CopG family nickel-responsive transcriptional regulator
MHNFGLNKKCIVMALKRFGVSLEDELLEQLDTLVKEDGYANRSQAIRFLIEKNLAEKKWQCNHIVAGTIFIIYDQQRTDISARISDIQIRHQNLVLSSQQHYINEGTCLHVCTVMGEARLLTALADEMTSIKGIRHGKLLMSRAD